MAYKCGLDLTKDQVTYIRSVDGKNKLDKFGNKMSSADQLLACYLGVSYLTVADKLETKLLSVRNKGHPTKNEQKILELRLMSKKSKTNDVNLNEPDENSNKTSGEPLE
jgi:hypothetical protein